MLSDFLHPIPKDAHPAVFSMCSLLKKHMELKAHIMEKEDASSADIKAADILLGHVVDDICAWVSQIFYPLTALKTCLYISDTLPQY